MRFAPIDTIKSPWIAFQGNIDQVCDANATREYVDKVQGAEFLLLPKVGHGFSVQKNWMPQFRDAFARLSKSDRGAMPAQRAHHVESDANIEDLPLIEVPAQGHESSTLAFMVSGDGGWASLDKQITEALAAKGVAAVGLDSLQYYWQPRSPDESGSALVRILRHYLAVWKQERVLLIGYSRGASVLPFMASRLPKDLADRGELIALLGPEREFAFEFRLSDWVGGATLGALPVEP